MKKKGKKTSKLCQNLELEKIEQKHCTCTECLWEGFLVLSQYYYYNTEKAIFITILREWYRSFQKHNPSQIYLPSELSLKSMGIWRLSDGGKATTKHKCSESASRSLLQQNSYVNQWKFCLRGGWAGRMRCGGGGGDQKWSSFCLQTLKYLKLKPSNNSILLL